MLAGARTSRLRARGMEYEESRPYQSGDDVRNIDWRVTARTSKTHTKLFREERERPTLIWLDCRRSMFFATRGAFKSVVAAYLAGLLAWAAHLQGDRVGCICVHENELQTVTPQRGLAGLQRVLSRIHRATEQPQPAAGAARPSLAALAGLRNPQSRGGRAYLISDFADFDGETLTALKALKPLLNLTLLQVYDPIEASLPETRGLRVGDALGRVVYLPGDPATRQAHRDRFLLHQTAIKQACSSVQAAFLAISTVTAPATALRELQEFRTVRSG